MRMIFNKYANKKLYQGGSFGTQNNSDLVRRFVGEVLKKEGLEFGEVAEDVDMNTTMKQEYSNHQPHISLCKSHRDDKDAGDGNVKSSYWISSRCCIDNTCGTYGRKGCYWSRGISFGFSPETHYYYYRDDHSPEIINFSGIGETTIKYTQVLDVPLKGGNLDCSPDEIISCAINLKVDPEKINSISKFYSGGKAE